MTVTKFNFYGNRGEADVLCGAGRCAEKFGTWAEHDPLVGGPAFTMALTYMRGRDGRGKHFVARTTIAHPHDTAAVSLALTDVPTTTLRPIVLRPSELPVIFTCLRCKRRGLVATPRPDRPRVDRLSGRVEEGRAM